MTVYIILFRGVGGATQLPVKPLRERLAEAGFDNVATYINSGNAVVTSRLGAEKVVSKISEICAREFGFHKDVHVRTSEQWRELIGNNPFPGAADTPKFLHAAVLAAPPEDIRIDTLRAVVTAGEGIEIVGNVAYLHTPHGFGTSKLAERFDKGIGVANTARNWNTVVKLLELAEVAERG